MADLKTKPVEKTVAEYIGAIEDERRRADCQTLLRIFEEATHKQPRVWGNGTVGFGTYHYKSERSNQEGDWMATGFAPRKQNITVYIMSGVERYGDLFAQLGKHKLSGGSCVYINKLDDIRLDVLKKIVVQSLEDLGKEYSIV